MWTPERIAAIPAYIRSDNNGLFKDAAPGHKFQSYLRNTQGLNGDLWVPYKGKAKAINDPKPGNERREAIAALKTQNDGVLNEVCELGNSAMKQLAAIRDRQRALHAHLGSNAYRISTTSTSPFATGLGNEHPIENGFAFLTPYGLPYLAGSGAKGILRRCMEELRDDGEEGMTDEVINALFGPEEINKPEDAKRGALDFWDVFPSPAGGKLVVEIMTPHFGQYYQGNETPHDSGTPVPHNFLTVPAKSEFDFHVICQPSRLPASMHNAWRALLDRTFKHAFDWVGFGAKTSVGYGAMATPEQAPDAATSASHTSPIAATIPVTQTWSNAKLTLNPGTGEIKASFDNKTTAGLKGPDADKLRASLGDEKLQKLKKNKELKGVSVEVVQQGNALLLMGLKEG